MVFLIPGINVNAVPLFEPDIEVVVDEEQKQVVPGESAVFNWIVYNNETYLTYNISVVCDPHCDFSENGFLLEPGENQTVLQTFSTHPNHEYDIYYYIEVLWGASLLVGESVFTDCVWNGMICVEAVNELNHSQNASDFDGYHYKDSNSPSVFEGVLLIISIVVTVTLVTIKKVRSSIY
ncbi:MAG: hypothetical protein JSW28_06050 [Thermoplasmata archaeon]|nr:MAG: hypothetical protein JSW28_06050 [Thermoplasmata archaeon]